jgi:hypothetical protein
MFKNFEAKIGSLLSIVLSVLGILFTIYYSEYGIRDFFQHAAVPLVLFSMAIILGAASYQIYRSQKKIEFFADRRKATNLFEIKSLLGYVSRKRYHLSVIGRTNISWLKDTDNDLVALYKKATQNGCRITFVIQHHHVKNENLSEKS